MSGNLKQTASGRANKLILWGVSSCYALSGFAALLYQTAWMRQFSLVFGTSELAVAAVLSAYMGGLAFGASLAARYVGRITRPVLFYGLLEGGIALSALAVPWLLQFASALYVATFGGQADPVDASGLGQSTFYLAIAFAVIVIPTALMGATLPLLTKYVVQSNSQIGSRVGWLYAINTAGAVAGTLVAGFLLLPAFGLNGTVLSGVAVNALVFALAAMIALAVDRNALPLALAAEASVESEPAAAPSPRRLWILPLMLVSGTMSFVYEVLWTRLLGHVLGGSITAFATMLAGFLSGIAIGSAIAARVATTRRAASGYFVVAQVGIAIASMLVYQWLPLIIPETPGLAGHAALAVLILLPATVFIGATFPLAVRIMAIDRSDAAPVSARVYSWNTVGAIVGATAAAFFIIPWLRYEGAIRFAVEVNAVLALASAALIGMQPRLITALAALFALGVGIFYRPAIPDAILRTSPLLMHTNGEFRYYGVGRSATVAVIEEDGYLYLRTNGLPEAATNLRGSPPDRSNQRMLSTMPVIARPDTASMLIVGLGGGVAVEGVPASVKSVDVIELEPEVVKANRAFGEQRAVDPLKDPRVKITINDARSALRLTSRRYDAIVSQPSHPWTAGASHLYTREFMSLARDHLAANGVFLQWMSGQFVDEFLLKSLCATMLEVFRYVRVYQWDPESLFFLGSDSPLEIEAAIHSSGRPMSDDVLGYLEKGVGSVEDVVSALAMDQPNVAAFARGGSVITDNNNHMATMSASAMNSTRALSFTRLAATLKPYDPLLQIDSAVRRELGKTLNFPYISRHLDTYYMRQRAIDLADSLINERNPQALIMIGLGQQSQGEQQESQKNLLAALQAEPGNQQSRFALLQPWFGAVLRAEGLPDYVRVELPALKGTGAATLRGWLAASKGDMPTLVQLDEELASVLPTDLWYETSVKLRAFWRIQLTTPELQPRMAREARRLIDSAIVFSQDPDLFLLRIRAANVSGDPVVGVETALRLIHGFETEIKRAAESGRALPASLVALRLRQVSEVGRRLADLRPGAELGEAKLRLLREATQLVTQHLEALKT